MAMCTSLRPKIHKLSFQIFRTTKGHGFFMAIGSWRSPLSSSHSTGKISGQSMLLVGSFVLSGISKHPLRSEPQASSARFGYPKWIISPFYTNLEECRFLLNILPVGFRLYDAQRLKCLDFNEIKPVDSIQGQLVNSTLSQTPLSGQQNRNLPL